MDFMMCGAPQVMHKKHDAKDRCSGIKSCVQRCMAEMLNITYFYSKFDVLHCAHLD